MNREIHKRHNKHDLMVCVSVRLSLKYCEGVTFAGIDALEPRVIKIWADLNRTVVEPSTAAEAATEFASIADAAPGTLAG